MLDGMRSTRRDWSTGMLLSVSSGRWERTKVAVQSRILQSDKLRDLRSPKRFVRYRHLWQSLRKCATARPPDTVRFEVPLLIGSDLSIGQVSPSKRDRGMLVAPDSEQEHKKQHGGREEQVRGLITLISAGRNRTIVIRRKRPGTENVPGDTVRRRHVGLKSPIRVR